MTQDSPLENSQGYYLDIQPNEEIIGQSPGGPRKLGRHLRANFILN